MTLADHLTQKGKLEGQLEERRSLALKLHHKGCSRAEICDLMELPQNELETLLN